MNTEILSTNPSRLFQLLDCITPEGISAKAKLYYTRYRSRRQLLRLDDSRLADIGLSREAMLKEAQSPFWR